MKNPFEADGGSSFSPFDVGENHREVRPQRRFAISVSTHPSAMRKNNVRAAAAVIVIINVMIIMFLSVFIQYKARQEASEYVPERPIVHEIDPVEPSEITAILDEPEYFLGITGDSLSDMEIVMRNYTDDYLGFNITEITADDIAMNAYVAASLEPGEELTRPLLLDDGIPQLLNGSLPENLSVAAAIYDQNDWTDGKYVSGVFDVPMNGRGISVSDGSLLYDKGGIRIRLLSMYANGDFSGAVLSMENARQGTVLIDAEEVRCGDDSTMVFVYDRAAARVKKLFIVEWQSGVLTGRHITMPFKITDADTYGETYSVSGELELS